MANEKTATEANNTLLAEVTTATSENDMRIPDYAIERFAKFLLPKIRDYYENQAVSDA